MIQFSKLRLQGFKSFVDRTEMEIGTGLTGVVGPNGCGKSNLVEALRWSMGESSSKRMRGGTGSMEDVIFNGTAKRPSRNMAEVSLLLDNSTRSAPGPYNNSDEIEVVRRIERDHGSGYRINGKNVRARDVQLLYADIMSGANSPFLVSQGKITNIIQAKPSERRLILEEAAGITGLYARRHEAELRLRATDNNLKRLEDLLGGMDTRLQSLKKQARQANRYRNLSAQIKQLEVMIAGMEWKTSHEMLQEIERKFATIETTVAEHLIVVTQLTKTQTTQAQDLPDLRQKEAEMAAALQAQKLALQRLEDEEQRLTHQIEEIKAQLLQMHTDRTHEQQTLKENTHILERLEGEESSLQKNQGQEDRELKEREQTHEKLKAKLTENEGSYTVLMEKMAEDRARRQSLEQQREQDLNRKETITARIADVKKQLAEKSANRQEKNKATALRENIGTWDKKAETLRHEIQTLEASSETIQKNREDQQKTLQEKESNESKLIAEINALESVLNLDSTRDFKPVIDDIRTDKGFEAALSRALGDTLMASTDDNAPVIWLDRNIQDFDIHPLPKGAKALEPSVKAPAALHLALTQIGVVENEDQGHKLAIGLKPGQALVSKEGAYWRWDGLQIKSAATDRHAAHLQQKNRLLELQKQEPLVRKEKNKAQQILEKTNAAFQETQTTLNEKQTALRDAEIEIRNRREDLNATVEAQATWQAELAKLDETLVLAESDIESLDEILIKHQRELKAFDDKKLEEQKQKREQARAILEKTREDWHTALRDYEIHQQEHSRRKARLHAIGDERVNLQNRCIRARERLKDLDKREEQLTTKAEELKQRPALIRQETQTLLSRITEQEQNKTLVSDKLASCETELAETTKALKQAESVLGQAREERAHAQATAAERQRQLEDIRQHILEHFDMSPEELFAEAAISDNSIPDLDALKQQREKAVRDRDLIGPVNLRADQEAEELEKELSGLLHEKNDLIEAIGELRQGIQKLNKEARERLHAAFEHVNAHFRDMFTRLFHGGKAHLALIESDDPLEAGLEIFAQPPGKALQSLSLLSGGEQTLTAIALIFAMFLTNPSPICVLDEVDAPLDDANVDRFCDLLDEFSDRGETRFLVITHHRLTMARMDRLYGVTMSEKGVSQLVSVDMNQQMDFLDEAA